MALEPKKLRELDMEELNLRVAEHQKEMFDTRQRLVTKEQDNTGKLRELRRDYARLLTVINEKKRQAG